MPEPSSDFQPRSARYAERVRESFAAQALMRTFGAALERVDPGAVSIVFSHADTLTQQHGFIHGGVLGAVLDSACGYAGFSLMEDAAEILTVEYKVNFLAAASGQRFRAEGRVIKPGRTLTVCDGALYQIDTDTPPRLIATAQATLMSVRGADFTA